MAAPEPIDLLHLGRERIIASYLLDTDDGPALFDCGPATTVEALKAGLADRGLALTDVRHLLLSHIHLDHAGAAGTLVREHPALQVHVSAIGAPHLVDPSRLEKSARRLYGDTFDSLWGELAGVPQENVHTVGDRVLGLDWAESVEGGATEEEFVEYAHAQLTDSREDAPTYDFAMPLWQSYRGLARWAEKRVARLSTES